MTPDEFKTNCIALTGSALGWQAEIAERLGVRVDTIRKAAKHGPSDNLTRLLLDAEPLPTAVHARWICGDGDDGREYLVHTRYPRFSCLIVVDGDDYDLEDNDGIVFHCGDGQYLANFKFIDKPPSGLAALMEEAANALEKFNG